ncbi:OsmC family protein [Rubrobacter indicoceani]|uniref:OsmC family protein n=1 Tax=Rubrobacter indicoceani TaxID=2051957 RepID=UPI000E5B4DD9|nr:OsmC family protein [Rubrobacter indicoceani]
MTEENRTTIHVERLAGKRYAATNSGRDRLLVDATSPEEGVSVGMRPMEALLASLGACSALDVMEVLEKRRTPPDFYRVELVGERAEEHPRRYMRITVKHIVKGGGVEDKHLQRAVKLSHEKYCSVHASLNAEIEFEAVLEG